MLFASPGSLFLYLPAGLAAYVLAPFIRPHGVGGIEASTALALSRLRPWILGLGLLPAGTRAAAGAYSPFRHFRF